MNILSPVTGAAYCYVAKPIMFKMPPDSVHNNLLRTGSALQKSGVLRQIIHASWAYNDTKLLQQTIEGVVFSNPVGLSAGFDKNIQLAPLIKAVGFGFMEGGTITNLPCGGNARPWFFRLPKTESLVVHSGLGNQGVPAVLKRLQNYPPGTFRGFPLNISIGHTNTAALVTVHDMVEDYTKGIEQIVRSQQADMLTLNISCPNAFTGETFTQPKNLTTLLQRIDSLNLPMPVFIKMPSNITWRHFNTLLAKIARHKIAGVTICNLTKNRQAASIQDKLPESVEGALSGRPVYELSNNLIRKTRQHYKDRFVIIGVGGIFTASDAYTKIKLGANLVELITGMVFNGPQLIGQINKGIASRLEQDGFSHISQAVGVDV